MLALRGIALADGRAYPETMFEYRWATEADIPFLDELIPRSVRGLQADFYTPAQMEGAIGAAFAVDSQLIRDGTYLVAVHGSQIVGCGGWSRRLALFGGDKLKAGGEEPLLDPKVDAARIRAFFIDPHYARRGLGSEIVRRCEAAIIAAGFTRAYIVATLPGELLFNRFGYAEVKRHEIPLPNGAHLPVIDMEKSLA